MIQKNDMSKRKTKIDQEIRYVVKPKFSFVYYYSRYFRHNWYIQWDVSKEDARYLFLRDYLNFSESKVSLDDTRFKSLGSHLELIGEDDTLAGSLITIRKMARKSEIIPVLNHELLHGVLSILGERKFSPYDHKDEKSGEPYCYAIEEISEVASSAILDSDYPTLNLK